MTIGNDLFNKTMAEDYGDASLKELQRKIWKPTPWMVSVHDAGREHEIRNWLCLNLGGESSPIHGEEGVWHKGSVTMDGKTWYGFKTEELLQRFLVALTSIGN